MQLRVTLVIYGGSLTKQLETELNNNRDVQKVIEKVGGSEVLLAYRIPPGFDMSNLAAKTAEPTTVSATPTSLAPAGPTSLAPAADEGASGTEDEAVIVGRKRKAAITDDDADGGKTTKKAKSSDTNVPLWSLVPHTLEIFLWTSAGLETLLPADVQTRIWKEPVPPAMIRVSSIFGGNDGTGTSYNNCNINFENNNNSASHANNDQAKMPPTTPTIPQHNICPSKVMIEQMTVKELKQQLGKLGVKPGQQKKAALQQQLCEIVARVASNNNNN
jgi:hypothetical protein